MNNPNSTSLTIPIFVDKAKTGAYLCVPFNMPPDTESFTLTYAYERHHESAVEVENGSLTARQEINIIDLGLIAPDGTQVGASGSDKRTITLSETDATPGYRPHALFPGEWQIILGAYKVASAGVNITYEITFTPKHLRVLKGDLHTHTLASDGVQSAGELAQRALRHGLDFLAITDHNQMVTSDALPHLPGLTVIPGVEWTHYQGHANFLGSEKPYDEPFVTHTPEETLNRFKSARERGATITINHPFEEVCPFTLDLNTLPFDCIEVWNGPMRKSNFKAVGLWHSLLVAGKKIAISGGSDYHRDALFLYPGGPTTCVYAMSASPTDILFALRQGHAYITFAPNGPTLEMMAGDAMLGDSVSFGKVKEMHIAVSGLLVGDVVQVVTAQGSTPLVKAAAPGSWQGTYSKGAPGFARVEILRGFLPGLPLLPALIGNPIYFDK